MWSFILITGALISATISFPTGKQRPNILYVLIDDVGFNDVSWNNPTMHTPYMHSLAQEGVILNNFYAMPLCTPSRATLLTGHFAQEVGLQRGVLGPQEAYGIPLEFKLLPETLRGQANYKTHMFGKWHLGFCDKRYTPLERGFDTMLGFYQGGEENYYHCLSAFNEYNISLGNCTQFDFRCNWEVARQFDEDYSTFVYGEGVVKVIEEHDSRNPFFIYMALSATHFPVQAPERFIQFCQNHPKARQPFCGAMAAFDEAVQNVTEALKRKGLYENTVIVLTSDNGGNYHFGGNNYPLRGSKGMLWEGGTRVPAFVHSPLLNKKGYQHKGLFHIVDWYQTFLHLAGLKRNESLDGFNVWPAISNQWNSPRREFPYSIDYYNDTIIAAIRVGKYKLIAGPGGNSDQWINENETTDFSYDPAYLQQYVAVPLPFNFSDKFPKIYNLEEDPSETNDLAPTRFDLVLKLWSRLVRYMWRAKPAVKLGSDPAGDPAHFNGVFSPGWCHAYETVPIFNKNYTNQNIGSWFPF